MPTAPTRQRPEEILASTLSAPAHPTATDGWSARGRRIFLVAMAAAGVLLVVAGLLVTKELAPRPGNPAPLQTGPGNGLPDQLLQSSGGEAPSTPSASTPLALPLPSTPTSRPSGIPAAASPTPVAPAAPTAATAGAATPPPSSAPATPTTTIPCGGLITRGLQQAQIDLPCTSGSGLPLGKL